MIRNQWCLILNSYVLWNIVYDLPSSRWDCCTHECHLCWEPWSGEHPRYPRPYVSLIFCLGGPCLFPVLLYFWPLVSSCVVSCIVSIFHPQTWFDLWSCNYYPKCIIIRWQTPSSSINQSSHAPGTFNQICPSIPGTFSQACGLFRHFPYLDYSGNLLPLYFVNLLVWAGHGQPVTW